MVRSLHLEDPLVDLRQVAGIIITGSPAYVTDKESWNFTGAEYVKRGIKVAHQFWGFVMAINC